MAFSSIIWVPFAVLDAFLRVISELIRVLLGKLVPKDVKQIYFQNVYPQSQCIQRHLAKLVPHKWKQIYFDGMSQKQYTQVDEVDLTLCSPDGCSKRIRYYITVKGKDTNCHEDVLQRLGISPQDDLTSVDESDVIIAFVPIVSRAKTDIEAALRNIPENQPTVLVVLHHTFAVDFIAPVSRQAVSRNNILAVDCLFHEDQGLLECNRNTESLAAVAKYLQDIKTNSRSYCI